MKPFEYERHNGKYRFRATKTYCVEIPELYGGKYNISELYYRLANVGNNVFLYLIEDYQWNGMGTTGFYPTTKKTARASAIHDLFYQCMRTGDLPLEFQLTADRIFRRICLEDGEPKILTNIYYFMVRTFGRFAI